jgi:phosphonate transport system substrate-binding protein
MSTLLRKCKTQVLFFCGIILVLAGLASSSYTAEQYTFGIVPQYEQRQLYATWKPLMAELERRTGLSFRLAAASTIAVFEKEFLKGSYDFAYMNPYHLLKANKAQGYVPIIRDRTSLRGILVVRKDSPIKNLSKLNNKVVAFPSPNALGASLLMRADLSELHHLRIVPLYVTSHDSVYLYVLKGLADAGGGVEQTLTLQPKPVRDALRILYTSRKIPSHPITIHPRVPRADAEKVRRAFLAIASTEKGRELLSKIPMKHPISASLDDYTAMLQWGLESFWVEE